MLFKYLLLLMIFAVNYNGLACGDNTQGGKRLCPPLRIEGNKSPCVGSTETYEMEPYNNHSSGSGNGGYAGCSVWKVYGGVITEVEGVPLPMPYSNRYENCGSYSYIRRGLVSITVKWGYDENGNLMNPLPQYGYVSVHANGLQLIPFIWGCDGRDDNGKSTDFAFNFAATPVQSIGSITGNTNPSCGWQTLTYSIPIVTNDATYKWTIPSGWVAYTSLNGKYLNTIQVRTNGTPPSNTITSGNVSVVVTQPCGPTLSRSLFINGNIPLKAEIGGPTQICSADPINITTLVTGGTQPYNYQWTASSSPGTLSCNTCANPVYTPSNYGTNLSLKVTDAKGCVNSVTKSIAPAYTTGWIGGFINPLLRPVQQVKAGSNLLADKNSNIYYTGADSHIYYFYFDIISNQWKVSSPIATNSLGPISLYEPIAGQKVLYYISNTGFVNKTIFDGTNWGTSIQVSYNIVKGNLTIDESNGNLYYRDSGDNLVKYSPSNNSTIIINTQIGGQTILVNNSEIYYFKIIYGNNVLYKTDALGNLHTQLAANYATPNSSIAVDNAGNVYFADWNNIYFIKKNSTSYLVPIIISNKSANGYFAINQATGVIYYITYDQNIYQCFYNGQQWMNVKTTSEYYPYPIAPNSAQGYPTYPASNIIYKYPHAFYIDVSKNVSNLFYFDGCTPKYERLASENDGDYLTESINNYTITKNKLICYPNPFAINTNINYTVDEISSVKISITSILGNEVVVLIDASKHETGSFDVNFDVSELSAGVYICNYYKNNILVKTNKLIIQK